MKTILIDFMNDRVARVGLKLGPNTCRSQKDLQLVGPALAGCITGRRGPSKVERGLFGRRVNDAYCLNEGTVFHRLDPELLACCEVKRSGDKYQDGVPSPFINHQPSASEPPGDTNSGGVRPPPSPAQDEDGDEGGAPVARGSPVEHPKDSGWVGYS